MGALICFSFQYLSYWIRSLCFLPLFNHSAYERDNFLQTWDYKILQTMRWQNFRSKKSWNLAGESLFTLMLKCIFRFMWNAVNHSAFLFSVMLIVKEKENNKSSNLTCRIIKSRLSEMKLIKYYIFRILLWQLKR